MIEEYKFWREYYNNRWGHRIYEVSNFGNVKCNGKIFEPKIRNNGYKMIGRYFIHRVVGELFIDNPENKPEIDHIDTNKLNNRVDNLRWVTPKENRNNPISKQHMSENHRDISGTNNPNYGGLSEEHKRKCSESHKGKTPWNKGKKYSIIKNNNN